MSKKNLILCFSSLRPNQLPKGSLKDREANYELSLKWFLKSLPENWDVIYNDNTISNLNELENESLRNMLSNMNVILHNNNHGSTNKGAGEHDMCDKSFRSINPSEYNWVTYFTARHIIPNSWYFDKLVNELDEYECVMSNPVFDILTNYNHLVSAPNNYNDMLFSMKSNIFKDFVDSIDVNNLKVNKKNSEEHLFEFVNNNNNKTHILESLGILRNDSIVGWQLI